MIRSVCAAALAVVVLASPLLAGSHELTPTKIRITNKNAEIFPELELRPQQSLPGDVEVPRFHSDQPQLFVSRFGGESGFDVSFAVDERRGRGKGFDFLVADVTGGKNLSKGKKVGGKPSRRGASYEDTGFPPIEILIPDGGEGRPYAVLPRFSIRRAQPPDSSLYLTALSALEGKVEFGDETYRMVVFDANCNGEFGDKGTPQGPGKTASGDKVWVGTRSLKMEDAYVEALPLGKYLLVDGAYYTVDIRDNSRVEIERPELTLGTMRVKDNPGFLLELAQSDGVVYVYNEQGDAVDVPIGSYTVNTPGFRRRFRGAIWELEGEPGGCDKSFSVKEGEVTDVDVGPPLRLMITGTQRVMGNGMLVSLNFKIAGSTGERYRFLRRNGKKVELPEISIRSEQNKEVKRGRFEYG
jgi:hypothetical protein